MNFLVLTIFPEMFLPFWEHGIIRRALEQKKISADAVNIRDFAPDRHRVTDDRPYGGGCGMVMKPEPLAAAIRMAREKVPGARSILLSPQGRALDQQMAGDLATLEGLILVCGRYEGVDERICLEHIDQEISIGDYVLTGGEVPAMIVMDAVIRLIPGVLGGQTSAAQDSFADGLIEHAHYTRPRDFEGMAVPDILLSGNHRRIDRWRRETSLIRTFLKRRDLLAAKTLDPEDIDILEDWCRDIERIIRAQSISGPDSSSGGQ